MAGAPVMAMLLLLCALSLGCGGSGGDKLLVFAASSLTDAMEGLARTYEEQTGVGLDVSFGASNSLAWQITRGAPADVFVSAGAQPIDRLTAEGLASPGSRRDLLTNRLVLVASADATISTALDQLAVSGAMLAIADPDLAPAGRYAKEALIHLELWDGLAPRLVYGANVRATLGYVELGAAEAALVYATDAAITDGVRVVATLPLESHSPIVYPGVVLARSPHQGQGAAFLDFLASDHASAVFRRMGFAPAPAVIVP